MTTSRAIYDEFYDGYRLFIGDLSDNIIISDLSREFSKFGDLIDVWVARNPPGFGFVVFHNKIDCERCQHKMNGRRIFGRSLRVEFARPTAIKDNGRAPASYQAYITRLRERGVEPHYFKNRSRSKTRDNCERKRRCSFSRSKESNDFHTSIRKKARKSQAESPPSPHSSRKTQEATTGTSKTSTIAKSDSCKEATSDSSSTISDTSSDYCSESD